MKTSTENDVPPEEEALQQLEEIIPPEEEALPQLEEIPPEEEALPQLEEIPPEPQLEEIPPIFDLDMDQLSPESKFLAMFVLNGQIPTNDVFWKENK